MFGDKARVVYEGDGDGGGEGWRGGISVAWVQRPGVDQCRVGLQRGRVRQDPPDQASGLLSMRDLCLAFISRFETPYL